MKSEKLIEKAFSVAIEQFAEPGQARVERNELQPEHFSGWIDWARRNKLALDFNGTFFFASQCRQRNDAS